MYVEIYEIKTNRFVMSVKWEIFREYGLTEPGYYAIVRVWEK